MLRLLLIHALAALVTFVTVTAGAAQGPDDGTALRQKMNGGGLRSSRLVGGQLLELQATDDVKVRQLDRPRVFDDKGNPRKPTATEMKEFKGADTRLPGYTADFGDVDSGQMITVTLARKKADLSSTPSSKSSPGNSKEVKTSSSAGKTGWIPVGEVTGVVHKVSSSGKKLTLRVDSPALHGHGLGHKGGKRTVEDIWITRIMILSKGSQANSR
jgi:hypothetical protein